jgi:hypothetical protein
MWTKPLDRDVVVSARLAGLAAVLALVALSPRPASGGRAAHINVDTTTKGAVISIDGKEIGRAPLPEPVPVVAGKHVVRVSKPGHTVFLEVVEVGRGQTKTVTVDLLPIKGILEVTANVPQARVYVDGRFVGRVPAWLELSPGKHSLKVSRTGYGDVVRRFEAKPGRVARLDAKMVPISGSAPTPPDGARVEEKWYEKWWFWASVAGGAIALGLSVSLPIALQPEEPGKGFRADRVFVIP